MARTVNNKRVMESSDTLNAIERWVSTHCYTYRRTSDCILVEIPYVNVRDNTGGVIVEEVRTWREAREVLGY